MNIRKKCIVLGANGYIGRHLVHFLKKEDFQITACDIHDTPVFPDVGYMKVDISDPAGLENVDWDVDCVFDFAGLSGTYHGFDNYLKYVEINELGLLNVLDRIRKSGCRPRVIFPSSRLVYKGSPVPLKEDDPKEPKTIYAANKLSCENLLRIYRDSFGIPFVIYRICIPYGSMVGTEYSYGTIGFFLKQALENGKISLFGDGSLRRTFTAVQDICFQIINSCLDEKSINQVYNIIGQDFSLKEVASLVAGKFRAQLAFADWPEKDLRIESGDTVFDSGKLIGDFGFDLTVSFENWLSEL